MTSFRIALATAAATLISTAAVADDEGKTAQMRVDYDQSTVLRLDRPAKTVIVGNSSIAEVQLIDDRTIYVLGRTFGNTNIIAIDAQGGEVINTSVTVGTPEALQVTVYRGPAGQRNLACAPQCERTVTPGDSEMSAMQTDAGNKIDIGQKAAALAK
jgi:Flp pilus assembly secretin CpaC